MIRGRQPCKMLFFVYFREFFMDIHILNDYKQRALLISQRHPELPLIIWNYSQKCQYEGVWDEITTIARGLVTDLEGNVVSRGFPKFWNIEEGRHISTDDFEVFEKLDGQYIAAFFYDQKFLVNSRGSFNSAYAQKASEIIEQKYPKFSADADAALTYCFELIGFEQIVVSYPKPDLILTGVFDKNGNDVFSEHADNTDLGVKAARKYAGYDYKNIKQLNWANSEGFVVRFSNGSRCKIKFEDYVRLHRQMTGLTTTAIGEALMQGKPVSELLNDVPDEFFGKVREVEEEFKKRYAAIEADAVNLLNQAKAHSCDVAGHTIDRKKFALFVYNCEIPYKNVVFAMLDGKEYSAMIWKLVSINAESSRI